MQVLDVAGLTGLWRRSLIVRGDGTRDSESWVRWLQGITAYIDLRQPVGRPDFTAVRCLRDLDMAQLDWLAAQDGFAGQLSVADGIFEWRRDIDFQPLAATPDRGTLVRAGDVMVEEGHHSPYVEHWHPEPAPGSPVYALRLRHAADGREGRIVRVGRIFAYARGRAADLPALPDLRACVAGAGSIVEAQNMADCEVAFGSAGTSGWTIERSTLPFREGRALVLGPLQIQNRMQTLDLDPDGREAARWWDVIEVEGDPR